MKLAGTIAASVAGTLLVLLLVLLLLIWAGAYNVSAAAGHTAIERWALETMMHNSVKARADALPPGEFSQQMIVAGAGEYKSMCQQCHGGPGVERAEWAQGLVPQPPEMTHAATEWDAGEIHWIVSNGIKMTAMPAFGPTHDDRTIWNIAAFVKQLPAMTPEDYAAFPEGHGGTQEQAGGHSHAGGEH